MARFTEYESKLLGYISDDRLRDSMATIRNAMEKIWSSEAPRIIKNYTDHGEGHSVRLVEYILKLLDANTGHELTSEEAYLLLSAVYLHDIGMQCDVAKYQDIQIIAEKYGAKFHTRFNSPLTSDYTIEEQKAIRENHNYLSGGWIDYANRSGDTLLGQGAKSIPDELVDDLIDICLHHSKIPIGKCSTSFKYNPNGRKQLIAAILRFADELDISSNRVAIETVKTYSINPANSLYWWLHNRSRIIFTSTNVIELIIQMHPNDLARYGPLFHDIFINEFQSKNRPVLTILGQNGIPIVISSNSRVVENDRTEDLPYEIIQVIQQMNATRDPIIDLAKEIRTWMRAIRYELSDPAKIDARTVDMVATMEQGTFRQRVLVRCIGGEITQGDIINLDKDLDRNIPQGWLISDKRISDYATKKAAEYDAILIFNLSNFLKQKVWEPYFAVLTSLVEKDKIPERYVDFGCCKQIADENDSDVFREEGNNSLDDYIDTWLKERGKMHISILGDFGSGKTWFCRHYAYRQLKRYLDDPTNERLPLLITLRTFAKAMTAQQLINDALIEQYKLPFFGSAFEIFQEINRQGKLLLILDGFDEMARQVDYQTVVDNFWELAKLVDDSSKVILTSRTEYFRWAKESEKILGGEEFGRRILVLEPPKFEVIYLQHLTESQIREVIIRRLGSDVGSQVAHLILTTPNLSDIAKKPVSIELLLAALDEVSADLLNNQANVYLYATNKLLLRNITADKTFTSTTDKIYFLCELAWEMIKSDELRIHYTAIPDRITAYFGDRIKDQHELDNWDFDLRNQTLLHRNAAGYYEFAHKSLAEYFVAFKFAHELGCADNPFIETYCDANKKPCQVPFVGIVDIELASTFGLLSLNDKRMRTVKNFLLGMLSKDADTLLWEIVIATKKRPIEEVKYLGGNAATLLSIRGASFKNVDLSHTILTEASLANSNLGNSVFDRACLKDADLTNCIFDNTSLRGANLTGAEIWRPLKIYSVSWSPKGNILATAGNDGTITVWDASSLEPLRRLRWVDRSVWSVSFSPNGQALAATGRGDVVYVWDTEQWGCKAIDNVNTFFVCGLEWSKDCRHLYVSGSDGTITRVNVHGDGNVFRRVLTDGHIYCLSLRPNRAELAAGCSDGKVLIIDSESLRVKLALQMPELGGDPQLENEENRGKGYKQFITSVDYSLDGQKLLVFGSMSFVVWRTLSYDSPQVLFFKSDRAWRHEDFFVRKVSFSSDGNFVAIPGHPEIAGLWDVRALERVWQLTVLHVSLCFNPTGDYFVSGGSDSSLRMWDVNRQSPRFGESTNIVTIKLDCSGMILTDALGLDKEVVSTVGGKRTKFQLKEALKDCGAVF